MKLSMHPEPLEACRLYPVGRLGRSGADALDNPCYPVRIVTAGLCFPHWRRIDSHSAGSRADCWADPIIHRPARGLMFIRFG